MPSVIFGYRRNVLLIRLGISSAFTGSDLPSRQTDFAPYRSYYFMGAYLSATVWSSLLAWFIWMVIFSIGRWSKFREFTFDYTRSIWVTWFTVTIWDIFQLQTIVRLNTLVINFVRKG